MKHFLTILFALFINTYLFAQIIPPKISAPQQEFDFGDIIEGKIVKHDFIIFNLGGEPLTISKVKASCGCTVANPAKNDLLPNDTTTIKVSFNSTHRMGKQHKYVYIFSNDPENPQYRIEFSANVLSQETENINSNASPEIKLSKYNHNFGNVKQGEVLDLTVDVINSGKSNLEITDIKSSCGCTAAMMNEKSIKPNEKSELKITFDTKKLIGQIARTVTLFSNDVKNPTRVLTLIANIEKE
jgi:hypothetical protein